MTGRRTGQAACLLLAEEVWGTTLHAMRSLAGCGAPVLVVVAGEGASIYGASRSCTTAVDIAADDPAQFCENAIDWVLGELGPNPDVVVIPLSDRLVDYAHQHRAIFPASFVLALPDPELTERLLDKRSSLAIAEDAGLHVPPWQSVGSEDSIKLSAPNLTRTALRPARWSPPGPNYFKIAVASEPSELAEIVRTASATGTDLVAQEYVEAADGAVEFGILWRSSNRETTVVCTGRKRRQSAPEGGVMIWGQTVELPDISHAAIRFLDESGFTGLGGIEFIRTASGPAFIEFNPRLEAIHFLATAAGLDTVAMAYEEMAGAGARPRPATQHPASAWVGSAWLTRIQKDRKYRLTTLRDWVSFQRSPERTRAIWSWRDPIPGIRVTTRLMVRALRSLRRGES